MDEYLAISIASVWMTVALGCGVLVWIKRKEVPDRSRTILSLISFAAVLCVPFYLFAPVFEHELTGQTTPLLSPLLCIGGLWAITLFVCYPIEVIRPHGLRGRWLALHFLPAVLVTIPVLLGLHFHELHSWADLRANIGEFDVLLRLLCLLLLGIISLVLLFVPYNWRVSSADNRWIRRTTLVSQGITVLFYFSALSNQPVFFYLHVIWGIFASLFFFYFELVTRLVPPAGKEPMQKTDKTAVAPALSKGNLWPRICQVMDEWEEWRNPNTTVETVSHAIGSNRSYVGQAIREHTGLTFNDFMNQKRIEFMASELRREPGQDQKTLYFEAGFRSRTAAYRNFVKFMGCSPTDYVTGAGASAR